MSEVKEIYFSIPKKRAELPALAVLAILVFVGWAFHYGIFHAIGGLLWLSVAIPLALIIYKKRTGEYFVKATTEGISFRQHFFSNYVFVPWNYMQRIDYLVFEINFMIKESAQVVCFQTSGLDDEQIDELKKFISDTIEKKTISE